MTVSGLQLQNSLPRIIPAGDDVLFDETLVASDPNITYNSADGSISFAADGPYYVSWFVAVKTALGISGPSFSIVTSAAVPRFFTAGSGAKNSMISGSALLTVTAGTSISLRNQAAAEVSLATVVQANAGITILNTSEPNVTREGFSAFLSSLALSADRQLTGWSVDAPYFNSGNFNAATGNYTVPASGRYNIYATLNYSTTTAVSVSLGPGVTPAFTVRRTSPTATDLITGSFPIVNFSLLIISLRAVLGDGTVTLVGEAALNQGDVIGLFYIARGLSLTLNLGGSSGGIVWSINRLN